jgi:hypothetical protein
MENRTLSRGTEGVGSYGRAGNNVVIERFPAGGRYCPVDGYTNFLVDDAKLAERVCLAYQPRGRYLPGNGRFGGDTYVNNSELSGGKCGNRESGKKSG